MIRSIVLCLLAVSTVLSFPADSAAGASDGSCPGGYAQGAEVERGRLVFVCQGGSLQPKGCIAEDLSRIAVGANYDTKRSRSRCELKGSDLSYTLVGCLQNGQEHKVGDTWEDGANFYTCNTDGTSVKIENLGCVDGGKRINKKDTVAKGDAQYLCDETVNGGSKLIQSGCVKDGKAVSVGDSFESGNVWYNCTRTGREKVQAKIAGCVEKGKRLNDGDRYPDGDVIYECIIEGDKQSVRAIACVQNEGGSVVERRLGCTWVEGAAPIQYEWACQHDAAANSAKKVQVRCNYNVGGGVYNIDPGCFRVVDKKAFGCSQNGNVLNLQSFNDEQAASAAGLHAC